MSRWQWQLESYLKKQSNKLPNFVTEPKFAATALVFSADLEQLLITKRSLNLTTHPGEYALPGGLSEPDETITQTALRELQEETGIESNMVSLIQPFFQSRTPYGMQVITCIARLKLGQVTLKLDPAEVDSAYWLQSDFFLQAENGRIEKWSHKNIERTVYFWPYGEHEIWGVTGEIIAGHYTNVTGKKVEEQISFSPSRQQQFWKNKREV